MFDLDAVIIYSICVCLTRVQPIIDHVWEKKNVWFCSAILEKLTRVEITTSTRMKTRRYTYSRIERLINCVYDYLEIQQWNSTMIAIFFLPLSLSQLLVISSSQSKGDERFFSLEIFISVAINVANRNRISHFNIGEITVSFSINHHSCYINQSFAAIDLQKNYINNSKSTIRSISSIQFQFTNILCNSSAIIEFILQSNIFHLLF